MAGCDDGRETIQLHYNLIESEPSGYEDSVSV